jgi:hypothetical protein
MPKLQVNHIWIEAPDLPHETSQHPDLLQGLSHSRHIEQL